MQNWINSDFFGYWKDAQSRITKCLSSASKVSGNDFSDSTRCSHKPATTLMCRWGESVVKQSLELQAKWIDLWIRQFEKEPVDLQMFSEQVQRINQAMHDWSGIQEALWKFWFNLLDRSIEKQDNSGLKREKLETWKKVTLEAEADLNRWFTKWEEQINCKPLVPDELNRLIEKLGLEMLGWIQNQAVLWQYGFDFVNGDVISCPDQNPDATQKTGPPAERDNLTDISAIGPFVERLLNAQNIVNFRQIASLSEQEIDFLEKSVLRFPGRIRHKEWIQEAKELCTRD